MGNLSRRRLLTGFGAAVGSVLVGLGASRGHIALTPPGNLARPTSTGTLLPFKAVEPASPKAPDNSTPTVIATPRDTPTPLVPTATALPTTYGPATIIVWHGHPEWKNGGAVLGEAFRRTYAQITVKISAVPGGSAKLRDALAAKDAPDILEVSARPELDSTARAGRLLDLTVVVDRTAWSPVTASEVTVDDKIRAVPFAKYLVGLAYDVATFQKAGISNPPKTWSDLGAAFAALKKVDAIPHATAVKDGSLTYYSYIGLGSAALGPDGFAGLLNGMVRLDDSSLVAVLDQMVKWGDRYQKKPESSTFLEARTLFATGQAASVVASTIDLAGYSEVASGRKLGFLAWPAPDASHDPLANRGLSSLFGVHAGSTQADAALGFVRWLGTPPAAQIALDTLNLLPALDGISPGTKSGANALIRSLLATPSSISVWQEHPAFAGLQPLWAKSGPALITKTLSPADFAKALQADVDKRRSAGDVK